MPLEYWPDGFNQFRAAANATADAMNSQGHYFTVEERYPDGHRWMELHRFPSKQVARAWIEAVVAAGEAERTDLRVHRVTVEVSP